MECTDIFKHTLRQSQIHLQKVSSSTVHKFITMSEIQVVRKLSTYVFVLKCFPCDPKGDRAISKKKPNLFRSSRIYCILQTKHKHFIHTNSALIPVCLCNRAKRGLWLFFFLTRTVYGEVLAVVRSLLTQLNVTQCQTSQENVLRKKTGEGRVRGEGGHKHRR